MQSFRDSKDRKWDIDFSFGNLLRLKAQSNGKFSFLDDATGKLFQVLWSDESELYECLQVLLEPQAEALGITAVEFGLGIAADCFVEARDKFFKELRDFFQKLQRHEMVAVLEKMMDLNQEARRLAMAKLELAMGPEFDQKAKAKINQAVNLAFGNLADSLDKTLAITPGDNST